MKKLFFILTCILYTVIQMKTISVSAWCGDKHRELVQVNSSYGKLTPSQTRLASYCAVLADDKEYGNAKLHGTGNYIKNLELLYTCAYNLKNNVPNPIESAFGESCKDPGYEKLYKKINLLISEKVLPGEEELSNTAKSAKVLGFACHMTGDIYAHRTIIPPEANKELFENTWNSFKSIHEKMNPKKYKNLPSFSTLFGDSLDENGEGFTLIKEQKANFLIIKRWANPKQSKKQREFSHYIALAFEDSPNFYSERYQKGAMELTRNLLTLYGENRPFDEKFVFQTSCSLPLQPATH